MRYLNWDVDGVGWPNRSASRFVSMSGVKWHVQIAGEGPEVLLLHGTGSATHTWRDVFPRLALRNRVIAVDLPGLGFSRVDDFSKLSLPGMAQAVAQLLTKLGVAPRFIVGHSAGAAIAIRLMLNGCATDATLIAINPAVLPLAGPAGQLFAPIAKALTSFSMVPRLFSLYSSGSGSVRRLLQGTGSTIDATGIELYRRLISNEGHVAATLSMMSRWDLPGLQDQLSEYRSPLHLMVGVNDKTIAPRYARQLADRLACAPVSYALFPDCGHLLHEEQPELVEQAIDSLMRTNTGPELQAMVC